MLPSVKLSKKVVDVIGVLSAYSFVNKHRPDQLLELHQLVHLVTRVWVRIENCLQQVTRHGHSPQMPLILPYLIVLVEKSGKVDLSINVALIAEGAGLA